MIRRITCLSLFALLTACASERDKSEGDSGMLVQGLTRLTSCVDFQTMVRERTRSTMNAELDKIRDSLKAGTPAACFYYPSRQNPPNGIAYAAGAPVAESAPSAKPASVSKTNNQVAGVDEADIVKTDGQFIYLAQGATLRIVKAWPAQDSAVASQTDLGATAKRLFVEGDRALVYVSVPRDTSDENVRYMGQQAKDCTYGYDCDFSGDGNATKILIFDIGNRSEPKLLRTIDLPGSLIAARRIGTAVHTVTGIAELMVPNMESYNATKCGEALQGEELDAELAKLESVRDKNNAAIDAASFDVAAIAKDSKNLIGSENCGDFYRETEVDGSGITTLLSLDLADDSVTRIANIVSRPGAVYASESSLYMAVTHTSNTLGRWYQSDGTNEASTVHRFSIGEDVTKTAYHASGIVPGHVLNQFAMDEYAGVLRLATSVGRVPDPNVSSVVTVLKQDGAELKTIGQVSGIAPTEDVRSVRFQGKRGYLVTFKKTDPLFVLDLAEATQPRVVGELKIPGFSTYMHPLDESHLLALGYEADDQGEYAYFNGIQLQIFDVKNPTAPTLVHKKVYGTRGSSSSALTDHLGFTFLPDRELLTLPINICEGGGNGQFGTLDFSGVVALKVSLADGFTELGRLSEPYGAQYTEFQQGQVCADWWTDSSSVVSRVVVMDDFVYAVSDNRVRVQNLNTLGTDVKVIDF